MAAWFAGNVVCPAAGGEKRRHRTHQILHLTVQQHIAVTSLERLHVVLVAQVPVGQAYSQSNAPESHGVFPCLESDQQNDEV